MSVADLIAILPLIVLAAGMVILMLVIAFRRSHALIYGLTLAVLLLAFAALLFPPAPENVQVTPLLVLDSYARFITGMVIGAAFVVALFAYGYNRRRSFRPEEFYLLLLAATLGAAVLAASSHFASFFIGLEILSISLYAMIGYSHDRALSIEAGIKYLILASSSAAFLLFGMALVYAQTGQLEFAGIAARLLSAPEGFSAVSLTGLVMMLVGFGFKLALVPFHMWTPDVYEGAPAPVTAFIASISKGSVFAVMLRFFYPLDLLNNRPLLLVFVILAVTTMLAGNLLALLQTNLKRLLAYSSVANLGYLLVAFLAGGGNAIAASTFYLVAYIITVLAAFGVVSVLSGGENEAGALENYRGLMWRRPWLAAVLTAAMLSLAGMPLTVGFMGKFYLVLAGVGSALWLPVIVLVVGSAIGLYYYLRVVVMLFSPAKGPAEAIPAPSLSLGSGLALAGLLLLLLWLGVYPATFIQAIQQLTLALR